MFRNLSKQNFHNYYTSPNFIESYKEEVIINLLISKNQILKFCLIKFIPVGIPNVHWFGIEGDFNIMVMDLLGPSLEDLFNYCGRKFQLKTVLMIADQILSRVEFFHSKNFLHRDLKPDNFVIGFDQNSNRVYIIDYGLAKKYRDSIKNIHIPYKDNKTLTGTARYASLNTHLGIGNTYFQIL